MLILDNIVFSMQRAGGVSVVWYELLKRLLKDHRFDCRFLEYSGCQNNIFRKMLELPDALQLPTGISLPIALQSRILPHVSLKGRHLFHSSYYRCLKNKNVCNITTVHDFIYEKYVTGIRRSLHVWQKSRAIRNSQAIVCISQNTREDLLTYYPEIKPELITVVYNGVSDDFHPVPNSKLTIPFESGSYLLFVGGRNGYKSFLPAVHALKGSGMNFVVVGGPVLSEEECRVLNSSIGEKHYLHLRGISNSELNVLYSHACALLYPSAYEGFGIPIVEAQKAGCPIICQNTKISREIAGDGALYFTGFSDIPDLIDEIRGHNISLISAGGKNAQRFSWDKTYQGMVSVYQRLMN